MMKEEDSILLNRELLQHYTNRGCPAIIIARFPVPTARPGSIGYSVVETAKREMVETVEKAGRKQQDHFEGGYDLGRINPEANAHFEKFRPNINRFDRIMKFRIPKKFYGKVL